MTLSSLFSPSRLTLLLLLPFVGCALYEPTLRPDYTIRVMPTRQGGVALRPPCPDWVDYGADPYDNQPLPQYGCADARNLAAQVEHPNDLVQARVSGESRGVTAVGALRRYDNNQTRGLIIPGSESNSPATTTSSNGSSALSGDVTGSSGSSGSSSSSAATSGP